MDITVNEKRRNGAGSKVGRIELCREAIKKALHSAVGNVLDDETRRATQEMIEERKNAIQQIAKEQRSLIKKIVDDEKKVTWGKIIKTMQDEVFSSEAIKESVASAWTTDKPVTSIVNGDKVLTGNNHDDATCEEEATLEILPPRDENAIAAINDFLNNMPEALKVELNTLVDKSVFKVKLRKPVNFNEKLASFPQVLNTEEVVEDGQKKIKICLLSVFI